MFHDFPFSLPFKFWYRNRRKRPPLSLDFSRCFEVRILDLLCLMDPSLVTRIFPAVKKARPQDTLQADKDATCNFQGLVPCLQVYERTANRQSPPEKAMIV